MGYSADSSAVSTPLTPLKNLEKYIDDVVQYSMEKMEKRIGQDGNVGLFVQLFAINN